MWYALVLLPVAAVLALVVIYITLRLRSKQIHAHPTGVVFAHPCLNEPAIVIAEKIARGQYTSVDVTKAFIEQIKRVNGPMNAVCHTRFEEALVEARAADAAVQAHNAHLWFDAIKSRGLGWDPRGPLPPFLGVPCSMKECFALEGMPNTSGLVARKGIKADASATVVRRYREAGFVILVTTNLSELCMWYESNNNVYGRTNNAYNQHRMVGGSSGGEAALISAAGAPCGIGSDVGGSIRMPAFFNGVFGHKPSSGLVPNSGQHPIAHGVGLRYLSTGPICRFACDLWPLLCVMAGPDGCDAACVRSCSTEPTHSLLHSVQGVTATPGTARARKQPLHVYYIKDWQLCRPQFTTPVSEDILASVDRTVTALQEGVVDREVQVHPIDLPELKYAGEMWSALLGEAGGPTFYELMNEGRKTPLRPLWEVLKALVGCSQYTIPGLGLALLELLPRRFAPAHTAQMARKGEALRTKLQEMLGSDGVLIVPTHPTHAPVHGMPIFRIPNFAYTAVFNVLECAGTSVPTGLDRDGMPVGVQIIGARGSDSLTIAAANIVSKALGGWVPPTIAGVTPKASAR